MTFTPNSAFTPAAPARRCRGSAQAFSARQSARFLRSVLKEGWI